MTASLGHLALVFSCPQGFVTDLGEPIELLASDGSIETLPRYAAWKSDRHRGGPQVAMVTNDLDAAIAAAKEAR